MNCVCSTKIIMYSLFIIIVLSSSSLMYCWDLSEFGSNLTVSHVALFQNRAILCVPRNSTQQNVTLLETLWPENIQTLKSVKIFPNQQMQVTLIYESKIKICILF